MWYNTSSQGRALNILPEVIMSKKQQLPDGDLLIRNYILNGLTNATQAAIDAGYSEKSAAQSASRVLSSDKGKKAVAAYKEKQDDGFAWTKNVKLKKYEEIVEAAMKKDPEKGMVNMQAAISALDKHNLMQGDNAPVLTDITHTVKTFSEMYGDS